MFTGRYAQVPQRILKSTPYIVEEVNPFLSIRVLTLLT